MVSVLASIADGGRFYPQMGQLKTLKFVFASFPLSTQHVGVRAMTDRPIVKIMCLGKMARLPVDCCLSELSR